TPDRFPAQAKVRAVCAPGSSRASPPGSAAVTRRVAASVPRAGECRASGTWAPARGARSRIASIGSGSGRWYAPPMFPRHTLVTGGAGFIGSHLVERLLAEGRRVIVVDDESTGALANLRAVESDPRLDVIVSRVSACPGLDRLTREADAVFHLAAAVGVDLVVQSPVATIHNSLAETEAVLGAAAAARVPVVFTSTSEVYGKSQRDVFREEDDLVIGPPHLGRWSYACSKLMDEFLALAYARERGLPVVIARLF